MEQSHAPIGIYDSGVGGLTVWLALKRLVKQDLIYYADTAHVPYGERLGNRFCSIPIRSSVS